MAGSYLSLEAIRRLMLVEMCGLAALLGFNVTVDWRALREPPPPCFLDYRDGVFCYVTAGGELLKEPR